MRKSDLDDLKLFIKETVSSSEDRIEIKVSKMIEDKVTTIIEAKVPAIIEAIVPAIIEAIVPAMINDAVTKSEERIMNHIDTEIRTLSDEMRAGFAGVADAIDSLRTDFEAFRAVTAKRLTRLELKVL